MRVKELIDHDMRYNISAAYPSRLLHKSLLKEIGPVKYLPASRLKKV